MVMISFLFILSVKLLVLSNYGLCHQADDVGTLQLATSHVEEFYINYGIFRFVLNQTVPNDVMHIIFQIHSPEEDVVLSDSISASKHNSVNGSHVGLVTFIKDASQPVWYIRKLHSDAEKIKVFAIVTFYTADDPIPGACNLVLPLPNEPNLELKTMPVMNRGVRHLRFAMGGHWKSGGRTMLSCETSYLLLKNTYYHLYQLDISPGDYDIDSQKRLLTLLYSAESVLANARRVASWIPVSSSGHVALPEGHLNTRQGRGVASVLIMETVVNDQSRYAAYVMDVNYGEHCGPNKRNSSSWEDCVSVTAWWWRGVACAAALFGLLLCFAGHRLFGYSVLMFGWLFAALVCSVLLLRLGADLQDWAVCTVALAAAGLPFALVWLGVWHWGRLPNVSLFLHVSLLGVEITCALLFFTPLNGMMAWSDVPDYLFALSLLAVILLIDLILGCCLRVTCSILSSSLIGSFAAVYCPAALFVEGTIFPYILHDTVLRFLDHKYISAVYFVNYYTIDWILLGSWASLFILGVIAQGCTARKRPSFPSRQSRTQHDSGNVEVGAPVSDLDRANWPPAEVPGYRASTERTPLLGRQTPPPAYTR